MSYLSMIVCHMRCIGNNLISKLLWSSCGEVNELVCSHSDTKKLNLVPVFDIDI